MTCAHPEKQRHASLPAALKARASLETEKGIDLALRPYRCGDHWHLGHKRKSTWLERKIRSEIAARRGVS